MATVMQATIVANNIITTVNQNGGASVCSIWNLTLIYNFESLSAINIKMMSNSMPCGAPVTINLFHISDITYIYIRVLQDHFHCIHLVIVING